jgi:hypothetical protein
VCPAPLPNQAGGRLTVQTAGNQAQGWLVGANYITSNAINQLEMFQPGTYDTRASIAQLAKAEAAWAAATEAAKSERIQLKRRIPRSNAETSAMAALLAADQLPAPPPLRKALHTIDIHLTETTDQARLLPKTG